MWQSHFWENLQKHKGPLCPGLALAWAAHVPMLGRAPLIPHRESCCPLWIRRGHQWGVSQGLWGRGKQLNEWPLSRKEEDSAMVEAPRHSTLQPAVSRAVHLFPLGPQEEAHN